jgi:hypothetical protein
MDKKILGALGAFSALATMDPAQAMTAAAPDASRIMQARSFAELLQPIPNAIAALQAVDHEQAKLAKEGDVKVAQWFRYHHHHHHHHHHRWWRYHHHHHHHHHRRWYGY